ncbi:response regulator transcription factor [Microcoleus sp. FACHB-1515]|uniref:response regulator transcription factor n=1 Tax=Cyanophyceae TaxID=3028117 RepID=UPI00168481D4|nr:response regulator transcription factor [Microcoleus sp. FACHB-1515]MBD2093053.1 response regulator transcription factor [Microcoleus sp. FACHB-1515]
MPLTILVVDDDFGTRLAIQDFLELSGYFVVAAADGRSGLEAVKQYQPHLIVTDVTMPEMDGYEFVRQVRSQPAFRLLPVIFLTARTEIEDRIRGYQTGGDVYLAKPFELAELGAVTRNLLDRSQLIQSELHRQLHSPIATPEPEEAAEIAPDVLHHFTDREHDVLMLLVQGLSNAQIGDRLHLSARTIEKYVSSLLRKTDSHNRADLVRYALEHHLV